MTLSEIQQQWCYPFIVENNAQDASNKLVGPLNIICGFGKTKCQKAIKKDISIHTVGLEAYRLVPSMHVLKLLNSNRIIRNFSIVNEKNVLGPVIVDKSFDISVYSKVQLHFYFRPFNIKTGPRLKTTLFCPQKAYLIVIWSHYMY